MLKTIPVFLAMLLFTVTAFSQATFTYDVAGNRVKRTVVIAPDLVPRITVTPFWVVGPTDMEISVAVANSGQLPTNGSEITVRVMKNPLISGFNYNPALTSTASGASVQNSIWTPSEDANYYFFKTTTVIPKSSLRRLVYHVLLNPGVSSGSFNLGATIPANGSGGESNYLNNQDAELITFESN
jgi:hypothetical protein